MSGLAIKTVAAGLVSRISVPFPASSMIGEPVAGTWLIAAGTGDAAVGGDGSAACAVERQRTPAAVASATNDLDILPPGFWWRHSGRYARVLSATQDGHDVRVSAPLRLEG